MLHVRALDRHGAPIDRVVRGITAGTYPHECDHLDGALFVDRVEDKASFCIWKELGRHHVAGFRERVMEIGARYAIGAHTIDIATN